MSLYQSPGVINKVRAFFRFLARKLPSMPSSEEIDREYIEGETGDEIGEISQMTDIPDKAMRHPHVHARGKKKVG